ncbi:hypothetical protein A0J61_02613 [Choanephora cucurbitarum]|uniref:Uncharacterized protein n=1 Tax=Choanephora cucurbitarum TaxID=101091 RepID=A0A1C7NLI5_9FUNG|nr:hypothetical protein A0J61_02613 [Choanephora cucurbitarum]
MSKRQRLMDQDWGISSSSEDTSSDEEEEKPALPPSGLFQLPFEILSNIFVLSCNPQLPVACRFFYNHLYYAPNTTKLAFLLYRAHQNPQQALEDGIKFAFFDMDLLTRFDRLIQNVSLKDKKIPARLFLEEPKSTLEERDNIILALLERGASPNRPKGFPLIKSAQLGRLDQVKRLISFGADPAIRNNMALRVCAARNNREMVNYFLDELKVKPDSETLKACVQKNLWEMIQVLVDHGAVPDMSTIDFT